MMTVHTHTKRRKVGSVHVCLCLEPPAILHISVTATTTHRDCIPFPWVTAIVSKITEHTHITRRTQQMAAKQIPDNNANKQRGHSPHKMMVCHVMSAIGSPMDVFSEKMQTRDLSCWKRKKKG
ncbi:uncharacterized protein TM35_000331590 [Trypanosoma theileri]|uniref:Uncharacterized protein n=1 Tax=Trypanosoma theileri TaxID=67003 RepID=A0A1X0NLR2_9TRYP|nr:uncharacterized protein TM35_000331590 [Trypanosoma theileri]ORC85702.1 hypothetical protein TM35_000331590 [Trypanosoma theileri]